MTLTATGSPWLTCSPAHTTPMPPSPIGSKSAKGPRGIDSTAGSWVVASRSTTTAHHPGGGRGKLRATLARVDDRIDRWLAATLAEPGDTVWWAGADPCEAVAPRSGLRACTWRLDVAQALTTRGVPTQFSVPPFPGRAQRAVVRMPKEKALARAAVAWAADVLRPGGELVLIGRKDEGAASIARAVHDAWGPGEVERDGPARRFRWRRPEQVGFEAESLRPQPRYEAFGVTVHAGPGVFSWKKLDPGTQRLLAWSQEHLEPTGRWLDLGCGAGLLARWLADRGADVVATDSNALALAAAEATLGGRGQVRPSDAGGGLPTGLDGVLCNPPFHRGFDHHTALTRRFAAGAADRLKPGGRALFVVNAFVPLEREARGLFRSVESVLDDGRYRVVDART